MTATARPPTVIHAGSQTPPNDAQKHTGSRDVLEFGRGVPRFQTSAGLKADENTFPPIFQAVVAGLVTDSQRQAHRRECDLQHVCTGNPHEHAPSRQDGNGGRRSWGTEEKHGGDRAVGPRGEQGVRLEGGRTRGVAGALSRDWCSRWCDLWSGPCPEALLCPTLSSVRPRQRAEVFLKQVFHLKLRQEQGRLTGSF